MIQPHTTGTALHLTTLNWTIKSVEITFSSLSHNLSPHFHTQPIISHVPLNIDLFIYNSECLGRSGYLIGKDVEDNSRGPISICLEGLRRTTKTSVKVRSFTAWSYIQNLAAAMFAVSTEVFVALMFKIVVLQTGTDASVSNPETIGSMILRNGGIHLKDNTV